LIVGSYLEFDTEAENLVQQIERLLGGTVKCSGFKLSQSILKHADGSMEGY